MLRCIDVVEKRVQSFGGTGNMERCSHLSSGGFWDEIRYLRERVPKRAGRVVSVVILAIRVITCP
jgi:hypothetical protein